MLVSAAALASFLVTPTPQPLTTLTALLSTVLPQATLHPPPSVKTTMMRGIYLAYVVILVAYFPVAICGYLAFGSSVDPDVLLSVGRPAWLTRAANFMVVIHVGASWQVRGSYCVDPGLMVHGWMQPCGRLRTVLPAVGWLYIPRHVQAGMAGQVLHASWLSSQICHLAVMRSVEQNTGIPPEGGAGFACVPISGARMSAQIEPWAYLLRRHSSAGWCCRASSASAAGQRQKRPGRSHHGWLQQHTSAAVDHA